MDLGISGKNAIVCASSKGLGKACAHALASEGVNVWICARHRDELDRAAAEIAQAGGGAVTSLVADVTTDEGREALLAACPAPDILVNNAGGPPPGDFRDPQSRGAGFPDHPRNPRGHHRCRRPTSCRADR